MPNQADHVPTRDASFTQTVWTQVLSAGRRDSPAAEAALSRLCERYWYPLYVYARRRGHSPEESEDLVQGFFAKVLEKNYLAGADLQKGRFRAFLLAMFNG